MLNYKNWIMRTDFLFPLIVIITNSLHGNAGSKVTSSTGCPPDVRHSMAPCLRKFEYISARHLANNFEILGGLDVEHVRRICSELRSSSRCINQLKDRCAGVKRGEVMQGLKMHVNLIMFCSKDNAMEDYALAQSCLQNERLPLLQCYNHHRPSIPRAYGATTWPVNVTEKYCRSIESFLRCVVDHVTSRCDEPSSRVADRLARAAIPQSVVCGTETLNRLHGNRNGGDDGDDLGDNNEVEHSRQKMLGHISFDETNSGIDLVLISTVTLVASVTMTTICSY